MIIISGTCVCVCVRACERMRVYVCLWVEPHNNIWRGVLDSKMFLAYILVHIKSNLMFWPLDLPQQPVSNLTHKSKHLLYKIVQQLSWTMCFQLT